jgi:hypothetical protein
MFQKERLTFAAGGAAVEGTAVAGAAGSAVG